MAKSKDAPPPPDVNTTNPAELDQRLTYDSYFDSAGNPVDAVEAIDTMYEHAGTNKKYAAVVDRYTSKDTVADLYVQEVRTRVENDPSYLGDALANDYRSKHKLADKSLSNKFIDNLVSSPNMPHYEVLLNHVAVEDDPGIRGILHPEVTLNHAPYPPSRESSDREDRQFEAMLDDVVARADDITRMAGAKRETMAPFGAKLAASAQQLNALLLARPDRARAVQARMDTIRGYAHDSWVEEARDNVDAAHQKEADIADERQGYRDAFANGTHTQTKGLWHNRFGVVLPTQGNIRDFSTNKQDREYRVLPALDRERGMERTALDALIARGRAERLQAQAEFVQGHQSDILMILGDALDKYTPALAAAESKQAASFEARYGKLELLEAGMDATLDDWRLDEGVNEGGADIAEYTSFRQLKRTAKYVAELQARLKEISPTSPWYDQLVELHGRVTRVHNRSMYKRGELLIERSVDPNRTPRGFGGRIKAHYNMDKSVEYEDGLNVRRYPDGSYAYTAPGSTVIDRRNPDGTAWVDNGDWAIPPHVPDAMPSWMLYREQQKQYAEWFKDQADPRVRADAQALSYALGNRLSIDAFRNPDDGNLMAAASRMTYMAHFINIQAGRTAPHDAVRMNPNGTVSTHGAYFVNGDRAMANGLWTFFPNGMRVVQQTIPGPGPVKHRVRRFDPLGKEI